MLGFLVGSLFAADSYYIFSGSNKVAWGAENYAMGFTWGSVTLANPENPYSTATPKDKDFVNEGVGKIVSASIPASAGVYIGINKSGGDANGKSIEDCTGGFTYWYKGGPHVFNIEYPKSNCGGLAADQWNNKWRTTSTAATDVWTKKTVTLANLTQIPDGACDKATVDLAIASQIAWGTQVDEGGTAITGYNLVIGNVACIGSGAALASDVAPSAASTWVLPPSSSSAPTTTSSSSDADPGTSSSSGTGDTSSSSGTNTSSSSGTGDTSSSSGAGTTSSSSEGTDPIISYNRAPVVGLNVVNFARSLRIASDRNATISLFDISGKQVLSQKVLSGTTTISLGKQKVGVYYAVAKSDSQKQIVKIVLK